MTLVSGDVTSKFTQRGQVSGTFDGEMTLRARLTSAGMHVHFSAQLRNGSVTGNGLATPRLTGKAVVPLIGRADITSGTGIFTRVSGRGLAVRGKAALDGSRAVVSISGTVQY